MLHDQLVDTTFVASIYMSVKRKDLSSSIVFYCIHNLIYIQQQIIFCSFDLRNKGNYHSKEQRLSHLNSIIIKSLHFNSIGKDKRAQHAI